MQTGKEIGIDLAESIANELGYSQIIIHGYDAPTGTQHVTTFGKTIQDSAHAAAGGNFIKSHLNFSSEACNSVSAKVQKIIDSRDRLLEILKDYSACRDNAEGSVHFDFLLDEHKWHEKLKTALNEYNKPTQP